MLAQYKFGPYSLVVPRVMTYARALRVVVANFTPLQALLLFLQADYRGISVCMLSEERLHGRPSTLYLSRSLIHADTDRHCMRSDTIVRKAANVAFGLSAPFCSYTPCRVPEHTR